jgi:DNA helicase-2/ATP-dependent DNA helicase PcrA
VREQYARRFEHILVDEFQDTNIAQYTMLKHLASFHRNLYVVGDADQSIYRWRGADYRNVTRFQDDNSDAQVILLEQNYRSSQSILDVAMAVIDHSPDARRIRKHLYTERGEGFKVTLYEATDDRVEAAFVVDSIASLVRTQNAKPGDFAVMYRTNAQSRLLEEAFLAAGLPYKLVGAQRFYGRREIKDIIAYLRLVHNPADQVSLERVINVPARGVGAKTLLALRMQAQRHELQPGDLLLQMAHNPDLVPADALGGRVRGALVNFGALLQNWIAVKDNIPPMSLMDRVLEDTGYQNFINDGTEEGRDRWENVMELRRLAAEFQSEGLQAFLERVALVADQDTLEASANVPTLLTLHAAKGLEFPNVFITGVNDNVLPHSRSKDDPEAMLEERRLFYVGITRAEDRLFLIFSQNRSSYGYDEPALPSPFLDDIPLHLVEEAHPRTRTRDSGRSVYAGGREKYERWELPSPKPGRAAAPAPKAQYSPGMHVLHNDWGEGIVLNSRMDNGDEILDIHFAGVGLKRVMASLARLEIKR